MPTIAEIGTNRLMNVLVRDKNQSPARTLSILKSEITALLECYLELDDEIKIDMSEVRGRLAFNISFAAVRVKDFDAVEFRGVVGCGNHNARVRLIFSHQIGNGRGGHRAQTDHIRAHRAKTCHNAAHQHIGG